MTTPRIRSSVPADRRDLPDLDRHRHRPRHRAHCRSSAIPSARSAPGAQGVDLSPSNPNGGTYFTLAAAGWGGTAGTGDTLVFTTVPAGCPLWYRRIVPAGAAAISSDPVSVCVEGETCVIDSAHEG
ncbi:MAG: hypothetical protein MZV65_27770 [Chromatiales bacterium]|nr:hypothetical protein [Chromatiales bacterium]